MLTVLLECRDNEPELAYTLAVLVSGAVDGLVSDVIVLDHCSRDGSARVADAAGCRFVDKWELNEVLRTARGEWIMLLEPGARPQAGWIEEVLEHASISKAPQVVRSLGIWFAASHFALMWPAKSVQAGRDGSRSMARKRFDQREHD